jgi:flagellar L-ring protein precursor FlgH
MTNIDKNEQLVTLTGWVRPQDVSPQNVVESLRVADAALTYQAKGNLDKPRGGFLSKLVGKLWP